MLRGREVDNARDINYGDREMTAENEKSRASWRRGWVDRPRNAIKLKLWFEWHSETRMWANPSMPAWLPHELFFWFHLPALYVGQRQVSFFSIEESGQRRWNFRNMHAAKSNKNIHQHCPCSDSASFPTRVKDYDRKWGNICRMMLKRDGPIACESFARCRGEKN